MVKARLSPATYASPVDFEGHGVTVVYPELHLSGQLFFFFPCFVSFESPFNMPKVTTARQKAQRNSKEEASAATNRAFGPIFNKDLGQHILKNPLVAQGIVDKVPLDKPFLRLQYCSPLLITSL